jgi:hypothetical protein
VREEWISHDIWLTVAGAREETNAEDAISVFRKIVNELAVQALAQKRRLFRSLD